MKTDSEGLKKYVQNVSNRLAQEWDITPEQSTNILKELENTGYFTVTPPQIPDSPATFLILNNGGVSSMPSINSYKPGNVVVNLHEKWTDMLSFIFSGVGTVAGINFTNPMISACGVISMLLSALDFIKIPISENGVAIIMALQNRGANFRYSAPEQQCFQDANAILNQYDCDSMKNKDFQKEIQTLQNAQCIAEENGVLFLREKVVGTY